MHVAAIGDIVCCDVTANEDVFWRDIAAGGEVVDWCEVAANDNAVWCNGVVNVALFSLASPPMRIVTNNLGIFNKLIFNKI